MKSLIAVAVMSLIGLGAFAQDGHRDGNKFRHEVRKEVKGHPMKAEFKAHQAHQRKVGHTAVCDHNQANRGRRVSHEGMRRMPQKMHQ